MDDILVILADGTRLSFEPGTSEEVIDAIVKRTIAEQGAAPQQQEDPGFLEGVGRQLMEFPAAVTRGASEIADIVASPLIAAERQVRPYAQAMLRGEEMPESARAAYRETKPFSFREDLPIAERGEFGGEGLATDILSGLGEAVPATAAMAYGGPAMLARSAPLQRTGTAINNLRQAGREILRTTPKQEALFTGAAVTGEQVGEEIAGESGGLIGSFMAPVSTSVLASGARSGYNALSKLFDDPLSFNRAALALGSMSDDIAGRILSENMVAEGMNVEDVIRKLDELGPEAIPADVSESFRSVLRAATNQNPALRGRAKTQSYERSIGQADRLRLDIDSALDAPNASVDEVIADLNRVVQPQIQELYERAGETALNISPTVRNLIEGDNTLGRSSDLVQQRLSDMRAAGEEVTNFDLVNVSKQVLDDKISASIRAGEPAQARTLIQLRNKLVDEADATMPTYKQARNLFAGKAALEEAARYGELIQRLPAREVSGLLQGFSNSEKSMFRVGARQAILDEIDKTKMTSDAVNRLFGRNGDVVKLRALFPDSASYDQFRKAMRREAEYIMTKNAIVGNSTTFGQSADVGGLRQMVARVGSLFAGGAQAKAAALTDIAESLNSDAGSDRFKAGLLRAGEILLTTGMDPNKVRRLLERPLSTAFNEALEKALRFDQSPLTARLGSQAARSGVIAETTGEE